MQAVLSSRQLNSEEASQKGRWGGGKNKRGNSPISLWSSSPRRCEDMIGGHWHWFVCVFFITVSYVHCTVLCYFAHNGRLVLSEERNIKRFLVFSFYLYLISLPFVIYIPDLLENIGINTSTTVIGLIEWLIDAQCRLFFSSKFPNQQWSCIHICIFIKRTEAM